MSGRPRRASSQSPTPTRKTLPQRSTRPPRASLFDGSDVDEIIREVTRTPGRQHASPVKAAAKRRACTSEESSETPVKMRKKAKATVNLNRKRTTTSVSSSSSRAVTPVKRQRGRPRKIIPLEKEESESEEDSDEDEEEEEEKVHKKRPQLKAPPKAFPPRPRGRPPKKAKPLKAATMTVDDQDEESDSAASSDEDGRYDLDVVDEAKVVVKRRYLVILKKNSEEMTSLYKGTFRNTIMSQPLKKYRTHNAVAPKSLILKREDVKPGREITRVKEKDRDGDPVPCHFIESSPIRPRMKHWVHIEHNIKTEDNLRLSHIPYVDDEHDSIAFCRELTKAYPEGIHGTRRGWGKHISDYLLYLLLKEVIPEWEKTGHEMKYLWRAIYKLFPNKLSARQLIFVFPTLDQRFNPKAAICTMDPSKKDDMYHSISTMLCIKCQQFHCLLHGVSSEEFRMHRKPRAKQRAQQPCGSNCYRHLPEVAEERSPRGRKKTIAPFSPSAQTVFLKMVHNNRNSYCQMSAMMKSIFPGEPKTCQEIYYLAEAAPPPERERSPDDLLQRNISGKELHGSFRNMLWNNGSGKVDNSDPPSACRHQGPCGSQNDDCYCAQQQTLCSKYCCCGPDCKIRFPGCRCNPGQCKTKQCQCFYAKWECDPDTCRSCNCGPYFHVVPEKKKKTKKEGEELSDDEEESGEGEEVEEEPEEGNAEEREARLRRLEPMPVCSNVGIQRGHYKTLRVGISNIAGYGCFLDDIAEKGEFIAEYTGELISKWEAERRGRVYDEYKSSYIFALNREQSVDATRFGNLIRFANHSDKHPNCQSQIIVINGEHRIGIFAKRHIDRGEELLFDYQYDKKWKEQYVPVEITKGGVIKSHKVRSSSSPSPRKSKKNDD